MVPRIYSQNNAVRFSAKMLFLTKLRHLKKLTSMLAFITIFSFQGYSQCPLPISVDCEADAIPMAIAAVAAGGTGCLLVTTGSYLVGTEPTLPVCAILPQSVTVRVIHDGTCDALGYCDVVVNITGDVTDPTFTAPADVTIECTDDETDLTLTGDVTDEADTCDPAIGEATYSDVVSSNDPCDGASVITRSWTLTDVCGNVAATQDQIITVEDTVDPTFSAPADITIECTDDETDLTLTGDVTDEADTCDPAIDDATYSDVVSSNDPCDGASVITRTWTLTDDCGNTAATQDQIITVEDTIDPTFSVPADVTIECTDDETDLTLTGDVIDEADTCDPTIGEATYSDVVSSNDPCNGASVITRTWTLTDDCGNDFSQDQIITVEDSTNPLGAAPASLTIPSIVSVCRVDALTYVTTNYPFVPATVALGYSDNCSTIDATSITLTSTVDSGDDCNWDVIYTYNVTDDCGNILGSETWTISGSDTDAPTGTAPLGTTGINSCLSGASAAAPAFNAATVATAYSDDCSMVNITNFSSSTSGTNCSWTVTYTYDVEDGCGNTLAGEQIVHSGSDQTVPTWTTVAGDLDMTIECSDAAALLAAQALVPAATDNCGGTVTVTKTSTGAFVSGTCPNSGTYTNTFVATDGCTNSSVVYTQVITIIDSTDPTWVSAVGALDVALDCNDVAGLAIAQAAQPTPNDNCSAIGNITIVKTAGTFNVGACPNIGTYTNTFIATDECTNSSVVYTQVITITDNNVPSWTTTAGGLDVTLACSDVAGLTTAQAMMPTATDNCSSAANITITETAGTFVAGSCPNAGTYTNAFIATDECGNVSATFTQTITITDNVAPTGTAPTGMTAVNDCLANAPAFDATSAAAGYNDDCGNVTATLTGTSSTGNDCNWTVTYTFSVTDDCGNSLLGQTIIHSGGDLTAPVIPTVADYSVNNAAGNCFQTVNLTIPAVTDNCGTVNLVSTTATDSKGNNIAVITPTTAPVAILPVGSNEITMNFTDGCGNSSSTSYTVTVFDDEAPNVLYPSGITLDYANCSDPVVVPNYGFLTEVNDNCSGYTITQDPLPGTLVSSLTTLASGQTFMVTITVTDNFPSVTNMGDSDVFVVTLEEDNTPVPNLPGAVLDPISGTCGPLVIDAPYAVDECGNTICGEPFPLPAGTINLGPACGAGSSGTCTNTSRDIPSTVIPENSGVGVNIPIEFTETGIVDEIEIDLDVNHTWVGDLRVTLTDPDGNTVTVFDRPGFPGLFFGCSGNDLDVTFTNGGSDASVFENTCNNSPAISGSFQPLDPFSIILSNNVDAEGTWILNISDNAAGDNGSVTGGQLRLCIQDSGSTATPDYLFPVGTHNITWNYDAGNGNIVSQQQVITVEDDNIAPTLNCVSDITLELDENGEVGTSASSLAGQNIIMTSGNSGVGGNSDFCVTSSSAQTIYFSWDYTTFDGPAFDPFGYTLNGIFVELTDPNGALNQSGNVALELSNLDVFCFRANTDDGTFGAATTTNINFYPGYVGDFDQANWMLVEDPGVNGSASFSSVDATDNCGVDESTILINGQSNILFDCADIAGSPIAVTVSVQDINGNTGTCTTNVTIVDNEAPTLSGVPADVTVDCNSVPSVEAGVTADDNCGVVGIIFNETSTQVLNSAICEFYNYQITRTWSVTDVNGNSFEDSQVITVQDVQGQIFASTNFPSTVSANANAGSCDAFVSLELTAAGVLDLPGCVSFDDLTITNNGTGAGTADASGTYPVGSTPVTFTVVDPCGNSDTYTVNVNVTDNTPPIAACNSITVGIPDGQDSILLDPPIILLIDNGSFDNCSPIVDLDVFPNVFYCSQIADGTTEFDITLAVSVPGSTDTTFCETTITIQDNNAPNIICVDPLIITLEADGTATATAAMLNGGIDDCSNIMTIELTGNTDFDLADIGSHPISDGITPTLQVTDVHGNVGTCTPTTLIVTPPTTCLTSVDVIDNGQVAIPYTSTNFTNVIGFQFSIQVDDETVATFAQDNAANLCGAVTINVPNLSGIHQDLICNGNFTNQISPDGKVLSVSWFNSTPDPVSIPDGESLFNFRLDALGVVGDITSFSVTGAPYSNELTTKYNNDILTDNPPLCINPIGTFEVGDNATLPISGNVSTWSRTRIDSIGLDTTYNIIGDPMSGIALIETILDTVILIPGQGLANASMVKIETMLPLLSNTPDTTDTDMTDANGDYEVQVANVVNGVMLDLVPRKNNPNWLNNGDVNSSDLFFIQQHIVNNIPFTSIYDYIAADVNQSGTITTLDLVLIQDVIVNPEISPIPSSVIDAYSPWRFIQKEYAELILDPFDLDPSMTLPAQPMAPVVPSANRVYNPAMLPMADVDWIAVKVGQIFGGLNTSTLITNDVDSRTGENFVMSVENQKVTNGELISIPVYAKDYAAFIAWQFTLEFDENYLAYEGIIPGVIEGFEENKLGLNAVEEGIIGALWYGNPNSVKSDEVLFTLQFTALDDADALSGLIDVTSRTVQSHSSLMSGATGEVSLTFFSPTTVAITDFKLHQNRPNPFNEETLISFNLPEAGFAKVTISDISGRTLKVIESNFAKGYNEVIIQSNELSATGVLYYQLESTEHIATKKMIILN